LRRFLFKTTVEQEAATSADRATYPTRGQKEDRGRIGVGGLIAEPGWHDEEVLIAAAEDGTAPASSAGTSLENKPKIYSSIFIPIQAGWNRSGNKQKHNIFNR
jgi:hypothetical protein